jgi:catalase
MLEADAARMPYNPFDLARVWYHKRLSVDRGGSAGANRNPENYFADVEQAAFNPANIVPGIGFSPDKMLQGRLFSYGDMQSYRLGVNHHLIPVNKPKNASHVNNFHRDGPMRTYGSKGSTLGYESNSYGANRPK